MYAYVCIICMYLYTVCMYVFCIYVMCLFGCTYNWLRLVMYVCYGMYVSCIWLFVCVLCECVVGTLSMYAMHICSVCMYITHVAYACMLCIYGLQRMYVCMYVM